MHLERHNQLRPIFDEGSRSVRVRWVAGFFDSVDLRGQSTDLGVQFIQALLAFGFARTLTLMVLAEKRRQPSERNGSPFVELVRMDVPFGRNLGNRFLFFQELKDDLGFERIRIPFPHGGILPPYLAHLLCPNSWAHYDRTEEKMNLKVLLYSMATLVPGMVRFCAKGTGGIDSARYYYSVWLRHLVMANSNGLDPYPKIVAELGPGDSLGTGLAALISGCDKYFALDVVEHANAKRNLEIFDELVMLYRNKVAIPGSDEFPELKPDLERYDFPNHILDENRLQNGLETSRIEQIKNSIRDFRRKDSLIQYSVPWYNASIIEEESVDMICSQAVLEHVDDLTKTYKAMRTWLKPTGYISHQIDFRCHGFADEWNGHWAHSDFVWKMLRGKRSYFLNREPHSTHITMLREEGFRVICDKEIKSESNLTRDDLAPRYRFLSDEDLTTSGAFIQAEKINQECPVK